MKNKTMAKTEKGHGNRIIILTGQHIFRWLNRFVMKGYKQNIQEKDMLKVRDDDSSATVLAKLEKYCMTCIINIGFASV